VSHPRGISLKEIIRERALELGFVACGVTTAAPLACSDLLISWIAERRHGGMNYLEREVGRRTRPQSWLPTARSVIVLAYPYLAQPVYDADWRERLTGRVAAYAMGRDYHAVLSERLARLCEDLHRSGASNTRPHVDFGPLVEKDLARRAGIGWYGHNTNLLTKTHGSSLMLCCVITDLEIDPDPPFNDSHCGTCRACVPACPTGALDSPPTIDAARCISYLTIELRGPIPASLRPRMGNWVFGCDDCQTVCPWNAPLPAARSPMLRPSLLELLAHDEESFEETFGSTALARAKRRGLARNAAVALGNSGNRDAVGALAHRLREDPEPLVRAHAAWALGRIGGDAATKALFSVKTRREIPPVVAEVDAAVTAADSAES